jgi:WD40 repeat protein
MDPELESFMRRPAKQLKIQHTATVDDTITCAATAATADGHALIAVGQADTAAIVVFNAKDLSVLQQLAGHAGGTNSLAFAGSSRLVSAGEDGAAAVWDPTGQLIARLDCEGENTDRYNNAAGSKILLQFCLRTCECCASL